MSTLEEQNWDGAGRRGWSNNDGSHDAIADDGSDCNSEQWYDYGYHHDYGYDCWAGYRNWWKRQTDWKHGNGYGYWWSLEARVADAEDKLADALCKQVRLKDQLAEGLSKQRVLEENAAITASRLQVLELEVRELAVAKTTSSGAFAGAVLPSPKPPPPPPPAAAAAPGVGGVSAAEFSWPPCEVRRHLLVGVGLPPPPIHQNVPPPPPPMQILVGAALAIHQDVPPPPPPTQHCEWHGAGDRIDCFDVAAYTESDFAPSLSHLDSTLGWHTKSQNFGDFYNVLAKYWQHLEVMRCRSQANTSFHIRCKDCNHGVVGFYGRYSSQEEKDEAVHAFHSFFLRARQARRQA